MTKARKMVRPTSTARTNRGRYIAAARFKAKCLELMDRVRETAGRLRLAQPVEQWIEASLDSPGVRLAELTRGVAVDAGFVPRTARAHPIDRLLVATARQLDATLMTADAGILSYAAQTSNLRVHDLAV
jgi:PIN domain nuclease of toxin-antitoxin system